MMDKAKLEYIWLDGYEPTQNMRSKTMVRSDLAEQQKNVQYGCLTDPLHDKQKAEIQIAYENQCQFFQTHNA